LMVEFQVIVIQHQTKKLEFSKKIFLYIKSYLTQRI
jgi:hypothetical protein